MHYKAFLLFIIFISSGLKSEIVVDPGEMVAVKISTCPDIKNKEIFFYTYNDIEYAITPVSETSVPLSSASLLNLIPIVAFIRDHTMYATTNTNMFI